MAPWLPLYSKLLAARPPLRLPLLQRSALHLLLLRALTSPWLVQLLHMLLHMLLLLPLCRVLLLRLAPPLLCHRPAVQLVGRACLTQQHWPSAMLISRLLLVSCSFDCRTAACGDIWQTNTQQD